MFQLRHEREPLHLREVVESNLVLRRQETAHSDFRDYLD